VRCLGPETCAFDLKQAPPTEAQGCNSRCCDRLTKNLLTTGGECRRPRDELACRRRCARRSSRRADGCYRSQFMAIESEYFNGALGREAEAIRERGLSLRARQSRLDCGQIFEVQNRD